MFPDAHLFFIGACALNPSLAKPGEVPVSLQMWDIHDAKFDHAETSDRAIVVWRLEGEQKKTPPAALFLFHLQRGSNRADAAAKAVTNHDANRVFPGCQIESVSIVDTLLSDHR